MHAAVATLQKAAQQLQRSDQLDRSKYGRIITQLRQVTDELNGFERRAAKQKADPVNFTQMLRAALTMASPTPGEDGIVPEDVMVEGPANDLRDLVCGLAEYALTVGCDPVDLRTQIKCTRNAAQSMSTTELNFHCPDVPDFLQRKLWDAVRIRRGEVSVISEQKRCRIVFALPVERRLAATELGDAGDRASGTK